MCQMGNTATRAADTLECSGLCVRVRAGTTFDYIVPTSMYILICSIYTLYVLVGIYSMEQILLTDGLKCRSEAYKASSLITVVRFS